MTVLNLGLAIAKPPTPCGCQLTKGVVVVNGARERGAALIGRLCNLLCFVLRDTAPKFPPLFPLGPCFPVSDPFQGADLKVVLEN